MFSWLRRRRRRRLLAGPFPVRWEEILRHNVGHYPLLPPPEQARLRDITRILLNEKEWRGAGGLFVTEEMRVTIAAQAALLLLGADHNYYARVTAVVVYPGEFRTPRREDDWEDDELSDTILAGQAVDRGPVILSWEEVLPEGRNPEAGYNVVIHEFAHQLDYLDAVISGPALDDPALTRRWRYVMTVALEDHKRAIKAGGETFFTAHAAENETEFFADTTEAFYCSPTTLKAEYPEIYQLLAAYYRVDPVQWFGGFGHGPGRATASRG
jgi:Mlc titration factor MtfA (ptsG expression regulator)